MNLRDAICGVAAVALWAIPGSPAASASFTYETARELRASGDIDGDGQMEVVVVDRETGIYRIGKRHGSPPDFVWTQHASGIENVTGFALGKFDSVTRDSLLFTSPDSNRLNVFSAIGAGAFQPRSIFFQGVGPSIAIPINIPGAGATAHDDIVTATGKNTLPTNRLHALRNTGSATSLLWTAPLPDPVARGNVVFIKGGFPRAAAVQRSETDLLFLRQVTASGSTETVSLGGLPSGADYAYGFFDGSGYSHFFTYKPGAASFQARRIVEASAGVFSFGAPKGLNVGGPIHQLVVLDGAPSRILVTMCSEVGSECADADFGVIYSFDGDTFGFVQMINLGGNAVTGAVSLGGGDFVLLTGADGRTFGFETYAWNGSEFVVEASGDVPFFHPFTSGTNVLIYNKEPLVNTDALLVRSLNAREWSSNFQISGGAATVDAEIYLGPDFGLGNKTSQSVGSVPAGSFGVTNQFLNPTIAGLGAGVRPVSIFPLYSPIGDEIDDVQISPMPGLYSTGVKIGFQTAQSDSSVFYRLSPTGSWQLYDPSIFIWLYKETTVEYYAVRPFSQEKSTIRGAHYTFTLPPELIDTDDDGVPDFVELFFDLDPRGGGDSDGDGYSDLQEILAGSNPNDPTDPNDPNNPNTASPPHLPTNLAFRKRVTPWPFDGFQELPVKIASGVSLRSHDPEGSLLGVALSADPSLPNPSARLVSHAVTPDQQFVTVSTAPHFKLATDAVEATTGRELLALVPIPAPVEGEVEYRYEGGSLFDEAAAWILAAQDAYAASLALPFVTVEHGIFDTLVLALFERKAGEILHQRMEVASPRITLTSFRPLEGDRIPVSLAQIGAIAQSPAAGLPAYSLRNLYETLNAEIFAPSPRVFVANLRAVVTEIYRISAVFNDAAPGKFMLPFDAIRAFIETGELPQAYADESLLSPATIASAADGRAILIAGFVRPSIEDDFRVPSSGSSAGCTLVTRLHFETVHSLLDGDGRAFAFPNSFHLLPGSVLRITGYTDVESACGGAAIEVVQAQLISVPVSSGSDADGNLLPDDWEHFHFGMIGLDPWSSMDGTPYSLLQQYLDGTDPANPDSVPEGPPLDLAPPAIAISSAGEGFFTLSWYWPQQYAGYFDFWLQTSGDLAGFHSTLEKGVHLGGGVFELTFPAPAETRHFYRVLLQLKQ